MKAEDKLIAKFMGFTIEKEVTVYNYGMDFRSSYDKEVIFCNKEPKLKRYEKTFAGKVIDVYENYFDSYEQDEDFQYQSFLNYSRQIEKLFEVLEKIENLGFQTDIINRIGFHLDGDKNPDYRDNIVFIWNDERTIKVCETESQNKFEAIYDCIVKFIKWYEGLISCHSCRKTIEKKDRTSNYTCKYCITGDNGFEDF